jgi:hypothetical protein
MKVSQKRIEEALEERRIMNRRFLKDFRKNMALYNQIMGLEFPDKVVFSYDLAYNEPTITSYSIEDLHTVRRTLMSLKNGYTDKIAEVYAYGGKHATARYSTSLGFRLLVILPIAEFPQSMLPSESCKFEEVVHKSIELSCPIKKAV